MGADLVFPFGQALRQLEPEGVLLDMPVSAPGLLLSWHDDQFGAPPLAHGDEAPRSGRAGGRLVHLLGFPRPETADVFLARAARLLVPAEIASEDADELVWSIPVREGKEEARSVEHVRGAPAVAVARPDDCEVWAAEPPPPVAGQLGGHLEGGILLGQVKHLQVECSSRRFSGWFGRLAPRRIKALLAALVAGGLGHPHAEDGLLVEALAREQNRLATASGVDHLADLRRRGQSGNRKQQGGQSSSHRLPLNIWSTLRPWGQ